mmetsp:Transcript_69994/g.188558  ORF Transcript_69994/g.188558 Transcript_69994/m.188558 type:complete len:245 (-) Transcript_69994:1597-2331(-)
MQIRRQREAPQVGIIPIRSLAREVDVRAAGRQGGPRAAPVLGQAPLTEHAAGGHVHGLHAPALVRELDQHAARQDVEHAGGEHLVRVRLQRAEDIPERTRRHEFATLLAVPSQADCSTLSCAHDRAPLAAKRFRQRQQTPPLLRLRRALGRGPIAIEVDGHAHHLLAQAVRGHAEPIAGDVPDESGMLLVIGEAVGGGGGGSSGGGTARRPQPGRRRRGALAADLGHVDEVPLQQLGWDLRPWL